MVGDGRSTIQWESAVNSLIEPKKPTDYVISISWGGSVLGLFLAATPEIHQNRPEVHHLERSEAWWGVQCETSVLALHEVSS